MAPKGSFCEIESIQSKKNILKKQILVCTAETKINGTFGILWSKTAIFRGVWQNVNMQPHPWAPRGVVRTGATGAMAPVDFENMCFGTRRFKTKRLNPSENALENYLFMYQIGYWHPLIEIPNDAPVMIMHSSLDWETFSFIA